MGRLYPKMRERPAEFRINYDAPLAEGLVFAGLGGHGCIGSMVYPDSSLYGNHGKLTNMDAATDWVWVPELGRWGNDFDGANDRISVPSPPISNGHFSLAAFAFVTNLTRDGTIWGHRYGSTGTSLLIWFDYATTNTFRMLIDGDRPQTGDNYGVNGQQWNHVVGVYDGTRKLYVNGTMGDSDTGTVAFDAGTGWTIGSEGTDRYFTGMLVDTCIWSRALTPSEISALADPSNVDLRVGGVPLILPPRRRFFASVEIPAPTFNPAWARYVNNYIGLGR